LRAVERSRHDHVIDLLGARLGAVHYQRPAIERVWFKAMNATSLPALPVEAGPYVALQREMHEALLQPHPEWMERDGNCPKCDDYDHRFARLLSLFLTSSGSLLALVFLSSCASLTSTSSNRLDQQISQADAAYRTLDADHVTEYNNAVATIARQIDGKTPAELRSELDSIQVKVDESKMQLPLARYHLAPRSRMLNQSAAVGVPVLLDYDTSHAPFYPPDGLTCAATAVYRRVNGERHLSLISIQNTIELNGSTFALNRDNAAPIAAMSSRGRSVAGSGFENMLSPGSMRERTGIFLTEPYDPHKAIVLLVPGLQSTPFAFADLMKAMRRDPEVSAHFQVWTFLYGTGTPVLFNALELRQELERTIRDLDPGDHDFATRHIVVLGHSMGGLSAHTLVSSSGDKLWNSLFMVPPQRLRGDRKVIGRFADGLHFRRNQRVVRVIFAATPHRGSNLAESWIGHITASLIHLPTSLQTDIVGVVSANRDAATPSATAFDRDMNFSSVHTLSPRDPALHALVDLPIEVPFHSIIGQNRAGAVETSSDGVVPYASSHLDGASSELAVRSGHGVCENPDAQREVIRILHLELDREKRASAVPSLAQR
jgi:triacylglycerol esterase/lipase EstA (alpha/beta hydrolase family)